MVYGLDKFHVRIGLEDKRVGEILAERAEVAGRGDHGRVVTGELEVGDIKIHRDFSPVALDATKVAVKCVAQRRVRGDAAGEGCEVRRARPPVPASSSANPDRD